MGRLCAHKKPLKHSKMNKVVLSCLLVVVGENQFPRRNKISKSRCITISMEITSQKIEGGVISSFFVLVAHFLLPLCCGEFGKRRAITFFYHHADFCYITRHFCLLTRKVPFMFLWVCCNSAEERYLPERGLTKVKATQKLSERKYDLATVSFYLLFQLTKRTI